jgi:hypothetical protein
MRTFHEMHSDLRASGAPCAYWGERGEWLVCTGRHRDSDALEESNFRVLLKRLGDESDTVAIERESHWAVGWVEHLLISPADAERVAIVETARDDLEQYPVLDDEDFSIVEHDRFWEFARGELHRFDGGWETILDDLLYHGNYQIGSDTSEWDAIESAREKLEELQPFYDSHAACPIDPRQLPLFN